jgi:glycosyltransferase involved in cell wall biosynthesis
MRACLSAIAAQTVKPLEVIVVNNNSTDKTAEIARQFPFVRVITERRQGRVFARNAGFNAARGDVIGRIDADIVLPPDWVEHVTAFYAQRSNSVRAWSGGGTFYNVRLKTLVNWAYAAAAFPFNAFLIGHCTLWGSNTAITRKQWRTVRSLVCHRLDIHEDLDLAIHLAQAGYRITYDPTMRIDAELRRVYSDRDQLWGYLGWWPRTLRVHSKKTWPICWFFGVLVLYGLSFIWLFIDKFEHRFTRHTHALDALGLKD